MGLCYRSLDLIKVNVTHFVVANACVPSFGLPKASPASVNHKMERRDNDQSADSRHKRPINLESSRASKSLKYLSLQR